MNEDNNQTGWLLKAVFIMQVLILLLFANSYFANRAGKAEYDKQMRDYQARQAEYEKGAQEYQKMQAAYNAELEQWQKAHAAYTNAVQSPRP